MTDSQQQEQPQQQPQQQSQQAEQPAMPEEKAAFMREHPEYGYDGRIDAIFAHELSSRLQGAVYLDHGGSGLYTSSLLRASHDLLARCVLSNPHSHVGTGTMVDQVRECVLEYLGVSSRTHSVVFTYNTSAALRLLSSVFPFRSRSELCYAMDNHNSVLGMRERMRACGPRARFSAVTTNDAETDSEQQPAMRCACSSALLAQHVASNDDSEGAASEEAETEGVHPCLFVYPAESNFDGRIYPLSLATTAHSYNFPRRASNGADTAAASTDEHSSAVTAAAEVCRRNPLGFHHAGSRYRWYTLLDASKLLATSPLDLSSPDGRHVDFVTMSFYKMFGYPTGLAALIVRNDTAEELWRLDAMRRPSASLSSSPAASVSRPSLSHLRGYFSGGTVNAVVADEDFATPKGTGRLSDLLEDGTVAFTSIVCVPAGLAVYRTLTPQAIHAHTTSLADYLFNWMRQQRYPSTNRPLVRFYGARGTLPPASGVRFGPTLNFSFLDQHGAVIGYKTVEKCALANRIYIRSGSFCNPGACQQSFPLSGSQIRQNLQAGYACWEDGENLGGVVNGSLRLSMGWCTRWEDVEAWMRFVSGEVRTIGMQTFISTQEASNGAATVDASNGTLAAAAAPATLSTVSPFDFQLPSYFHRATPVASAAAAGTPAPLSSLPASKSLDPASTLVSTAAPPLPFPLPSSSYVLSSLTVYPIKSCGGVNVPSWLLQSTGGGGRGSGGTLFLDREFVLLDAQGVALSQKTLPQLQRIKPAIDLKQRTLTLTAPNMHPLVVQLDDDGDTAKDPNQSRSASMCALEVCGSSAVGYVYDAPHHAELTRWLTSVVGKYTCLARKSAKLQWPPRESLPSVNDELPISTLTPISPLNVPPITPHPPSAAPSSPATVAKLSAPPSSRASFANEDDFLLVSASSVREVERRLHDYVSTHRVLQPQSIDAHIPPHRFRPNFVIDSAAATLRPFAEDGWRAVRIGPYVLRVSGPCSRCVMVNVSPDSGERQSALYALLNAMRKKDGRVLFGVLLSQLTHCNEQQAQPPREQHDQSTRWWPIHVGMPCEADATM